MRPGPGPDEAEGTALLCARGDRDGEPRHHTAPGQIAFPASPGPAIGQRTRVWYDPPTGQHEYRGG